MKQGDTHLKLNTNNNNDNSKELLKSAMSKKILNDGDASESNICRINKKLLPLKITLFLYHGAMSALIPYLTIHMKDIGISLMETAIIYVVLPFTSFLGPLLMGFTADKLGNYKVALVVATIINGIFHLLLLTVPKYSESMGYATTTALIEFNRRGPTFSVFLKPFQSSECKQLINSVREHNNNDTAAGILGGNTGDSNVINIHSCRWGHDWNQSNPLASGLVRQWNIPQFCRQKRVDESSSSPDDLTLQLLCGLNGKDYFRYTYRPTFTNDKFDPTCSIKLNLEGASGQGIQNQVTCLTNYTFSTGEPVKRGNRSMTFWIYFLIRTVSNLFMEACYSLLDASILAIVKANESQGAQYGKFRIFCVLGSALISPLAGLLVDAVSHSKGFTDYSPAFYLANAMLSLNVIGYIFMKLEVERPKGGVWKNAADLFRYPEVIVFLIMVFILGNMYGFVETYVFVFLNELNAPMYLLGLTMTVGSLTSIPFLYGANGIVDKAGRVNIIVFAFFVYLVRCIGYSFIPSPFWSLPFEAMEAFTKNLMWVAAATYCAVLAPKGLLGTLTGLIQSLHYGLGKGSGSFIGGYVISISSSRLAFRYFGIFGFCTGVIYFLLNKLWLESAVGKRNEMTAIKKGRNVHQQVENDHTQSMLDQIPDVNATQVA